MTFFCFLSALVFICFSDNPISSRGAFQNARWKVDTISSVGHEARKLELEISPLKYVKQKPAYEKGEYDMITMTTCQSFLSPSFILMWHKMSISNREWESGHLLFINVSCYQRNKHGRWFMTEDCTRRKGRDRGRRWLKKEKRGMEMLKAVWQQVALIIRK